MLHAVILAGGSGTRFWPLSRRARPKQFLSLAGRRSLLRATFERIAGLVDVERVWVAVGNAHREAAIRELPEVPVENFIVEPCGRNTAACIGLAAVHLAAADPQATMLVLPSDHMIEPPDVFHAAVERAVALVDADPQRLALFGVPPTEPATSFGYIECGLSLSDEAPAAFRVAAFKEKPERSVAAEYLSAGTFYWNSGMFLWRAGTILANLAKHAPGVATVLDDIANGLRAGNYEAALRQHFPLAPAISIDYAVLEKVETACLVEAAFDWDDVGGWESLPRRLEADEQGNTIQSLFANAGSNNCIVYSTDPDHLVATCGMADCIVVHTPDATLIARRDDPEAIRRLIDVIGERGLERYL